jgi:hypothetical protein
MGSSDGTSTYQEPVRLMNSSIPTDRRTSQKEVGAVWQQERTPDYFVTYLIRQGTRNTIIGYRLEAHQWRRYNYLTLGPRA